jgi:RimJ/RimL family protein N-acetyltransferase
MLRQVTLEDAQFLYDLLAERPTKANISHRKMPTFAEHKAFIASKPYAHWYIIEFHGHRIGATYLTAQNEIGIGVLKRHQGKAYAQQAIAELMKQHPQPRYLANIAPGNDISHKLFRQLGFSHIQNTYELLSHSRGEQGRPQ